jgi:3-isopropylmalate/(R)-2-methylmalate dehydratase small subunit
MSDHAIIDGRAAVLRIANLDTDQIMPKQFLRGIDKAGLAQGLLYDLRFDGDGNPRQEFILNQPAYAASDVLIAGPNFGCGSSREHAVWGMQQFGFKAVIAPSFAEIFHANAMNNRLMLVTLPEQTVEALMQEAETSGDPLPIRIDVERCIVRSTALTAEFSMAERYRRMFLDGLDVIGATLMHQEAISAFAATHWAGQPWLENVAWKTCERLAQETRDRTGRPGCTAMP